MAGQPPNGKGPPLSPRHAAPTGHASQEDSAGPPHPHTRTHSTWAADHSSPPRGWAAEGGGAPELRRLSQRRKTPPPGTPFRHCYSAQQPLAGKHAVGPLLGPQAHTNRTQDTRIAEPRLHTPEDGWPGEGQRLTPDAPHNGGRPPSQGTPPHSPRHAVPTGHASQEESAGPPHPHTRTHSTWAADHSSPPRGWAAEGGGAPELRRLSQRRKTPPPGTPLRHRYSAQQPLARAHAVGPLLGPQAHTNRTQDTRIAEPRLHTPEDGWPGEGQRLTPDAPHNGGRPPSPGTPPHHPRGTQSPPGMQAKGTVLGPHTRTPAPTAHG